ncbi:unnamed protein product [Litomosoides sigmodontis]|uniref:Uncharacterized protein n=1 Tax=Litomosoides sigmodontis TaxID=42156 RepID=A0A3P6UNX8_LITSI|nr:unnamed protein product [Litomosoides sigmodontis]
MIAVKYANIHPSVCCQKCRHLLASNGHHYSLSRLVRRSMVLMKCNSSSDDHHHHHSSPSPASSCLSQSTMLNERTIMNYKRNGRADECVVRQIAH